MATVTWTPQDLARLAKLDLTANGSLSISDTYRFLNDGKTIMVARKTGAGTCNFTVTTPRTVGGSLSVGEFTGTIAASTGYVMLPPLDPDLFNDANGYASVTFDNITGLDVAVVRLP